MERVTSRSLDDSITTLFKRGLKSFNSSLSAVNFSGLVPQARQYAASTIAERIAYVQVPPPDEGRLVPFCGQSLTRALNRTTRTA